MFEVQPRKLVCGFAEILFKACSLKLQTLSDFKTSLLGLLLLKGTLSRLCQSDFRKP